MPKPTTVQWYFGEDVIDYVNGSAVFTEGTWLAGRDGPPAMIMPAKPKLGDVFQVENVIGIVFEELTVAKVDQTVQGPHCPVSGAIVVDELGVTGGHSQKTLGPAYGEFLTADGPDLEAMAVTVPADAQPGGVPLEIRKALTAAWGTLEYVRAEDWPTAGESAAWIARQVAALDHSQQPPRVMALLHTSLTSLQKAVAGRNVRGAEQASVTWRSQLSILKPAIWRLSRSRLPDSTCMASNFGCLLRQPRTPEWSVKLRRWSGSGRGSL